MRSAPEKPRPLVADVHVGRPEVTPVRDQLGPSRSLAVTALLTHLDVDLRRISACIESGAAESGEHVDRMFVRHHLRKPAVGEGGDQRSTRSACPPIQN
jgi:hypothetical protein